MVKKITINKVDQNQLMTNYDPQIGHLLDFETKLKVLMFFSNQNIDTVFDEVLEIFTVDDTFSI